MTRDAQERTDVALDHLRSAVKRAGGASKVARKIRTPRSHLGNVLTGKRALGTDVCGRLRGVVKVAPVYLLDLVAPEQQVEGDESDAKAQA